MLNQNQTEFSDIPGTHTGVFANKSSVGGVISETNGTEVEESKIAEVNALLRPFKTHKMTQETCLPRKTCTSVII